MTVGIPVTLIMLPVAWFVLTKFLHPVNIPANEAVRCHLHELREEMGPITTPEKRVAVLFMFVILSWMLRRPLTDLVGLTGISDADIVMTAGRIIGVITTNRQATMTRTPGKTIFTWAWAAAFSLHWERFSRI